MGVRKAVLDRVITSADPLDGKSSVRVATTQALPAYTRNGNVITANANGALPAIDGKVMAVGESLLLKNGASAVDDGIYTVTQLGSGGAPFILTRRNDADATELVNSGMNTVVEEGIQYGGRGKRFVLITPNPIVLNTTPLEFQEAGGDGAGIAETVGASEVLDTDAGKLTPMLHRLGGSGAVGGDGVLKQIAYDENFSHFHIPLRAVKRVPERQQMLYKGIPFFDGLLIADGIVTEAASSAEELLEILGTVLDLDEILMGGGSPAVARGPAEVRTRLDVYSRSEVDTAAGDGRPALWWNGSSNADGSQNGTDSSHDISFTAEVGRVNKWLSQFAGIVATLPDVDTENHNRRIAFFDVGSGGNPMTVTAAVGDQVYRRGVGSASITIHPFTFVELQGDWSTQTWRVIREEVFLGALPPVGADRIVMVSDVDVVATVGLTPGQMIGRDALASEVTTPLDAWQVWNLLYQTVGAFTVANVGAGANAGVEPSSAQGWRRCIESLITPTAPGAAIAGLVASPALSDFIHRKMIRNGSAVDTLQLNHEDGTEATATNRIRTKDGLAYVIAAEGHVWISYSPAFARWFVE